MSHRNGRYAPIVKQSPHGPIEIQRLRTPSYVKLSAWQALRRFEVRIAKAPITIFGLELLRYAT